MSSETSSKKQLLKLSRAMSEAATAGNWEQLAKIDRVPVGAMVVVVAFLIGTDLLPLS